MTCILTSGRQLPCKEYVGGLYKLYFINFGDIDPTLDSDNIITDLSAGTYTVYQFELKGTSSLTQEMVSSRENGTTSVTQTLQLELQGGNAATNNQLKVLAYGRPHAVVTDNYGSSWLVGRLRGLELTTSTFAQGANVNDKYGYSVTMIGNENEYANYISGSTLANINTTFDGLTSYALDSIPTITTT